jgi:hypothetical protein
MHLHELPDGRLESIEYSDPKATKVIRRQIVLREGEDDLSQENAGPSDYKCDVCRSFGTEIERVIERVKPVYLLQGKCLDRHTHVELGNPPSCTQISNRHGT